MHAAVLARKALVERRERGLDRGAGEVGRAVGGQQRRHVDRRPDAEADRAGRDARERALGCSDRLGAVAAQARHLRLGLRAVHPAPAGAALVPGARELELRARQLAGLREQQRALQLAVARDEAEPDALGLALAAVEPVERLRALAEVAQDEHDHLHRVGQAAVRVALALERRDRRVQPVERGLGAPGARGDSDVRDVLQVAEVLGRLGIAVQPLGELVGLVHLPGRGEPDHLIEGDARGRPRRRLPPPSPSPARAPRPARTRPPRSGCRPAAAARAIRARSRPRRGS